MQNMFKTNSPLLVDHVAAGIFQKKSTINHEECRKPMSTGRTMTAEWIKAYWYSSSVYSDRCQQKQMKKHYQKKSLPVAVGQCSKPVVTVLNIFWQLQGLKQAKYIFPVPPNSIPYKTYPSHLAGDKTSYIDGLSHPGQNNI